MVIGLDGVSVELLRTLGREGVTPHIQELAGRYGLKSLMAPLPEVSSVSWTSFMTGSNPGGHGIYGFTEINRRSYGYSFPSFKSLPVKTIWEKAGEGGKTSIIINLPNTYPVRPMKGILIAGFVALDLKQAVYPAGLLPKLEEMDYKVDVDTSLALKEPKLFFNELHDILDTRAKLYREFRSQPWDLFFFIETGTDRLHHFFYGDWDDPGSKYYGEFRDYYRHVDEIVGEITSHIEQLQVPFVILSDHGFKKIKREVHLSQYLKEWGYLDFEEENPRDLKSIKEGSRVFVLDPSRVYIHLEGKYGRGCVKLSEYRESREEIREKFRELTIDNERVIRHVYYKEELYEGSYMENAPDLVLWSNDGFDLKAGITRRGLYGNTDFKGMHSRDNAFLIDSLGFPPGQALSIDQVGKQIEAYMTGKNQGAFL